MVGELSPPDNLQADMPSTTHPDAFHFDHPVPSFWEATARPLGIATPPLAGDTQCDVAVIGAGYTGLSAALRLKREYGMDVRVLEAGEPGWGASGRNGGFSCIGCHSLNGCHICWMNFQSFSVAWVATQRSISPFIA